MPKRYPEELRRKVLDLVASGRPNTQIADHRRTDRGPQSLSTSCPNRVR